MRRAVETCQPASEPAAPEEPAGPPRDVHALQDALRAGFASAEPAPPAAAAPPAEPARPVAPAPAGDEPPAPARRARKAGLAVAVEPVLDYALTAQLATDGFGAAPGTFTAEALRWLYETAFSDGTTVLAAHADGAKVGHIALVHQTVSVAGRLERAVALIDLFILKAFRSRSAMAALYGAVEAFCRDQGIRFILAVPNEKAAGVNTRYLKLADAATLDIRVGLSGLPRPWNRVASHRVASHRVADLAAARGAEILARYCGAAGDGLLWTGERLWARLQRPGAGYAVHAGRDVLAVSAPRRQGRAPHTMICALLARPGTAPGAADVGAVVAAACRLHRRPLFVYLGLNAALPRPGLLLPARLRPSPMVLQARDLSEAGPLAVSRFEALDFDFL